MNPGGRISGGDTVFQIVTEETDELFLMAMEEGSLGTKTSGFQSRSAMTPTSLTKF
ncbi:hypothetical protein K443DRAFT_671219 [Laccaria amethystina LaAM-08-1]|uniref:Uncharacterized protein n=1 Tax=Laccaria amethystina LaAM-08-1 TaxID=1095629 RepID=A0A0C9XCC5_9AGAR|nr:hypothetical protein K443DRAFT_671219 [Laccaria amethystina LaAM-08-1]